MATFNIAEIGDKLFEAVSNGKITASEYKAALAGLKVIKKVM